MKFLFPYMARWNSANMSRYSHLFNKIAEAGHTVIVVQPPARISQETNYIDIPIHYHSNIILQTVEISPGLWNARMPMDKFFKKALYTIASYLRIRKLAAVEKPDAIVVYNLPQYIYTFIPVPIVFDYADDYIAMLAHELGVQRSNILCKIGDSLLSMLIQRASLVTSVSQMLHDTVRHPNAVLLPNGADLGAQPIEKDVLHIDKSKPVIGYIGAFEYFIDLDLMIETAASMPEYSFLIVGAGREFVRVKEAVRTRNLENVILTGAVSHRQAMQFALEMDVCLNLFVKSDVADAASPIKLFEYMAKGKPIISTRLREIVRIDPNGEIVYYADTLSEVTSAIREALTNVELRARKTARGSELVRSEYNWKAIAERFVQYCSDLKRTKAI